MDITVPNTSLTKELKSSIENPDIKIAMVRGERGPQGVQGPKGDKGDPGATYDDTDLKNRVTALENTVGTLNDQLEGVLMGNGN